MARKRKPGRPKGSKNKKRRSTSRKKTTRKTSRKKTAKRRSGKVPTAVIVMRAKSLKKNKRAAKIYRDVLGC